MQRTDPRICHVNLAGGFRGGERQTELLARELAARGWLQRLVVRTGSALTARCGGIPGLELEEVAPNPVSAAWAGHGCALLHAHEERAVYSGWLLKRSAGTPYVLTRRVHHPGNVSVGRRLAWQAADRVVAVSESIARSVTKHYAGMPVAVVPDAHAGLCDGRAAGRSVLADLGGKTLVGHVGELDHRKGQGTIIEAARVLRDSRPELHFVLLGEGRDESRFRCAAEGLDNVSFAGFVKNVQDYLGAFDVFVYPSLFEGLGSTLLDAMAFGLPIVASEVGGIPEVVRDGVNGLLIPPERPDALVQALERLLDDAGLRASMGRENRARAAQFSAGRMADAYEAIYRSILAAGTGPAARAPGGAGPSASTVESTRSACTGSPGGGGNPMPGASPPLLTTMQTADDRTNTPCVCHVNLAAGFRGGERQTQLLISELAARGWPQRLVARRGGALAERCRDIARLEVREVMRNPLSAAAAARGAALVHAHEAHAVYAGWLLKRSAGTPYLLTRRLHHAENRSLVRRLAWRESDSVVAISGSIAESITAQFGAMPVRIVHSAHADMLNGHATERQLLAGHGSKIVVGHIGELDHGHKGQRTIIEAARAIRASRPDLHFVLVGEGKDGGRLRRAAEGLDNVSFAGFVENVEDYLGSFDVFVYPSLFEGLGSVLLDAMAFGLPIVASRVGGIPEVVEDGVNGLLIPPERPDALVQALTRLLDDDDLRASMRRENRARAAQFSAQRMADAYESIYRSILDSPPVP